MKKLSSAVSRVASPPRNKRPSPAVKRPTISNITNNVAAKHVAQIVSKRFADDPLRSKAIVVSELKRWWTAVCEEINADGKTPSPP